MKHSKSSLQDIRQSEMSKFFRARFIIVSIALFSLIAIVLGLILASNQHESVHNHIVNVLGKQRMYTQRIAQQASRIASIYEAIESDQRVQSEGILKEKLIGIKTELTNISNNFDITLQYLHKGVILYEDHTIAIAAINDETFRDTLNEIEPEWKEFMQAAGVVVKSTDKDIPFRHALIFINEHNDQLLSLTEQLTDITLQHFAKNHQNAQIAISILIALVVFLALWILFGTYRYIIEPYTIFYNGIKSLGTDSNTANIELKTKESPLIREVQETIAVMRGIIHTIGTINQGTSFYETLHLIFTTFRKHIPYNHIGIATFSGYKGTTLQALHGESDITLAGLPRRLAGLTTEITDTSLQLIIETGQPRIINDLKEYAQTRPERDYTKILLEAGIQSSITLPIIINKKALGFLFFSSIERYAYTDIHVDFLRNIRNAIALSFEKNLFVDELVYSSTLALAKMAEARDEETGDHLERMKQYTVLLTRSLKKHSLYEKNITPEFLQNIERFSPMHDIGKVGIRDAVLRKPGRLDPDEMKHMRTHARYGAEVLQEAENNIARSGRTLFQMGISIAKGHHEWWDGRGYPEGISGNKIPLEARIVAVTDVLDALTSRRPYKEPFSFERSVQMIASESGTHFDPEIVAVFLQKMIAFRDLYAQFTRTMPENY